ncbi:MAG: GntP family permease [Planctomycetales bacterium]|jgi:GntP family gluconate:H+ symporter
MLHPLLIMTIGIVLVIVLIMKFKVNAFIALITAAMAVSLLAFDPVYDDQEITAALRSSAVTENLDELQGKARVGLSQAKMTLAQKDWVREVATGRSDYSSTEESLALAVLRVNKEALPEPVSFQVSSAAITRVALAFGGTCGGIGIVIALAAVIGTCMMDSGAADRIVRAFMKLLGEERAPWALMGSGYVLAVPVFFDTVFYLLVPLARSVYKKTGKSYLKCLLAITAGGAITHTLVPPTPGPLTMALTLDINLGKMILVGAAVALPAAIAGIWAAGLFDRWYNIEMREVAGREDPEPFSDEELPGLCESLAPVVLPVLMIACDTAAGSVATFASGDIAETAKGIAHYTAVFGNPSLALLVSTVIALGTYVRQRKPTKEAVARVVEMSLMSGGVIILITAGGSAFGAMLKAAQVGDAIKDLAESTFGQGSVEGMLMLFLGFGIASVLKFAQGSSTAAMIITSGMMVGMVDGVDLPYDVVYLATAIGAGSLVGSWMNDSGFWIFAKMGGLTEKEALQTWTPLLIILGIVSMAMTLILATVMPLT